MKNCLAVFNLTGAGLEYVRGILRFFSEIKDRPYTIHLCEPDHGFTEKTIQCDDYDGFIIPESGSPTIMNALIKTKKPLVLLNITDARLAKKAKNTVSIWIDNHDIGRLGAQHLLSQNLFKSFGFIQLPTSSGNLFYSRERESAFRGLLRTNGIASSRFPAETGDNSDTALRAWISKLPKPTGIMTVNDLNAVRALNCCKALKLSVPHQVSILGVNDVRALTEGNGRSLSSVRPDFARMGYVAAKELVSMLARSRPSYFKEIVLPVKELVVRKSSTPSKTYCTLVDEAMNIIKNQIAHGITPHEVARKIRKSRRLLDLRFKETHGQSLSQAIDAERIKLCKEHLVCHHETLSDIAFKLGFQGVNQFCRYFKRHSGITITEYRRKVPQMHR